MRPRQRPPPAGSARSTARCRRASTGRCARGRRWRSGNTGWSCGCTSTLPATCARCGCWTPPATRHDVAIVETALNRSMWACRPPIRRGPSCCWSTPCTATHGRRCRRVPPGVRTAGGLSHERFHPRHPARSPLALRYEDLKRRPDVAARVVRAWPATRCTIPGSIWKTAARKAWPGQEPGRLPDADGDQPRAGPAPARPPLYERRRGGHADASKSPIPPRGRRRPWPPATRLEALARLIDSMPPRRRAIFLAVRVEERSNQEVAVASACPTAAGRPWNWWGSAPA